MGKRTAAKIPIVVDAFKNAQQELLSSLSKSFAIPHSVVKGEVREQTLQEFFQSRLPFQYRVVSGLVADLLGNWSPQLDLMVYDQTKSFPILDQPNCILPSEALLSSIEVKSTLTRAELQRAIQGALKLRNLKPYKNPLAVKSNSGPKKDQARYFHCLFAYSSDLKSTGWAKSEYQRYLELTGEQHAFDMIYVLGRGVIQCDTGRWLAEEEINGRALVAFYFGVLQFSLREARRRAEPPFSLYATEIYKNWADIE